MHRQRMLLICFLSLGLGINALTGRAADVAFFGIIKSQEFVQTNASPPVVE